MGYTHYWSYLPESEQFRAVFPQLLADARTILEHLDARGIPTAGPLGQGLPELAENVIAFNGVAPQQDYESFAIETGQDPLTRHRGPHGESFTWTFCKTACRPYDLAVMAVLLRAYQLAPLHVALSSDGEWDIEWMEARELIADLFEPFTGPDPLCDSLDGPKILHLQGAAAR